ncbi:MAG: class D sortase [Bryobacteraceae bacterium]|jgi:sortase A
MKLLICCRPLQCGLRILQSALVAAAFSLLAWCGFVVIDAHVFQADAHSQLDRLLAENHAPNAATAQTAATSKLLPVVSTPLPRGLIGRIDIERLGVSVIVIEGSTPSILRRAAGHIEGTALPGQPGNVGISAHRDTFFRPLRNIRENDVITLTTPNGEYRYRVLSTQVVNPRDIAVLSPNGDQVLTLVTCYPFYFVGPASKRFIVRAARFM